MSIFRKHHSCVTVFPAEAIHAFNDAAVSFGALGLLAVVESGCDIGPLTPEGISACSGESVETIHCWIKELGEAKLIDIAEGSA